MLISRFPPSAIILLLLLSSPFLPTAAQERGAAGLGDTLYPQLGNGGYDVQHYHIDLRFDPEEGLINAITHIDAIAAQDLSSFNLDFYGLEVSSVKVNDQVAHFEREASELMISTDDPLLAGEAFSVSVDYAGIPAAIDDPAVSFIELGWQEWSPGYVAALSQPSGAMNWFPSNNHPLDKATYSLHLTVPKPLTAVANGKLINVIELDDNARSFVWEMDDPMASYLSLVAIGDFVEIRDDSGTVPIRNYFPTDMDPDLRANYDSTEQMLPWLEELLGPYPFAEYGIVVLPGFPAFLETQSLSTFAASRVDDFVIMHELVHQWYGNSVTLADWQDIWLHEGFATYFGALWLEETEGDADFDFVASLWLGDDIDNLTYDIFMSGLYDIAQSLPLSSPATVPIEGLFGTTVYIRGALVLHALRETIGDDIFFQLLRQFYQDNKYDLMRTADFIALAEALSQRDLTQFFADWLYDDTLPAIP